MVLLYDTAARASEIINLKVEDIYLEQCQIVLDGKGKKKRIVPIMDNTKKLLMNYINNYKIYAGYLFKNRKNNKQSREFIADIIRTISRNVDINKKITPHTFRRSRATHLLNEGVNIVYIKELLGHESIETTQEYAKAITEKKFEAIRKTTPEIVKNQELPDWNDDSQLLNQLLSL